jgi:phage gp36-like protein
MARFIQESDYAMQIRQEIIRLLTSPTEWFTSIKLIRAEQTAVKQIRHRIGRRYNCGLVFAPASEIAGYDTRDEFIVTITIDIALYHLYSQTGMKDIPEHRQQRYQDALDWLRDVGNGDTLAELPEMTDGTTGEGYSEFMFQSRTPENHKW